MVRSSCLASFLGPNNLQVTSSAEALQTHISSTILPVIRSFLKKPEDNTANNAIDALDKVKPEVKVMGRPDL
jgi:hypothetical protein